MNRKIMTKLLAAILAFLLSFANVAIIGMQAGKTYASSNKNLEAQETSVNKSEIEFDAYFQEEGKNVHQKTIDVGKEDETLYISIRVKDGYLSKGAIKIENANFKVQNQDANFEAIQSISSDENKITLNHINRDESVILAVKVRANADSSFAAKDLTKRASILLEGTYVNNKGKEVEISKRIETETIIDGTAENDISAEVTKYVPFNVNGNKGVILGTSIKSKLIDNKLPVKQTKLEIEIPMINSVKPEIITPYAKSTMATNGKSGNALVLDQDYKIENGKIVLTIENNEDMISWVKDAQDEIMITYVYGENAVATEANLQINAKANIEYYGKEVKSTEKTLNETVKLSGQIGDIVTVQNELSESKLFKGYMLAENGKTTNFTNTININIGYRDLMDKITFKDETSYVDEKENIFPSNALYTYTKVSKENIVEILGEDGYINIYSNDGEKITTLNKDNAEYKFEEETSGIMFETSKPIQEGIIKIENGRAIKALEYSKAQEEFFKNYKVNTSLNVMQNNTAIVRGNDAKNIELENPSSQAEISISNNKLSTVEKNEGVELRVTLKTTDASSALYKNPEAEIVLPRFITDIDVENVSLVYEKDLKIKEAVKYRNDDGNLSLKVKLDGEQTSYNEDAISEGATLMMKADIKTNELTPTSKDVAKLNVINNANNEIVEENAEINFVAPAGIATISQVEKFEDTGKVVTSISGKQEIAEVKTNAPSRIATVKMMAINNYTYDCENIAILGRTPFAGNKGVTSGKDLGSTFTAKMVDGIKNSQGLSDEQMTVYYSANGEASKDLNESSNGWVTDMKLLPEVKSYMIVLNNYAFKTGELLSFNYNIEIPAKLEKNQSTRGAFTVFFEKAGEENSEAMALSSNASISAYADGPVFDISTAKMADLSVRLEANVKNGEIVAENSNIEYTAYVTNNSDFAAENVTAKFINLNTMKPVLRVDEGEGDIIGSGTIPAKSTVEYKFIISAGSYVDMTETETIPGEEHYYDENGNEISKDEALGGITMGDNLTRDDFATDEDWEAYQKYLENKKNPDASKSEMNKIKLQVVVEVGDAEDKFYSEELSNNVIKASEKPTLEMTLQTNIKGELDVGNNVEFSINTLANVASMNNVVITCEIPEGLDIDKDNITKGGVYNEDTRTITWNFETLKRSDTLVVKGKTNGKQTEMKLSCKAVVGSETFTSKNEIKFNLKAEDFTISQTSSISKGTISAGQEITYNIVVKNLTNQKDTVTIKDELPKELKFVKLEYVQNGNTVSRTTNAGEIVTLSPTIEAGETLVIHITGKAQVVDKSVKITNNVTLSSQNIKELKAEPITHTLIGKNGDINPGDPTAKYTISGTAWLDENRDGKRDDNEKLLSGINVYLIDSANNNVVSKTITNQNGAYTFANVGAKRYAVVFEYDHIKYDITLYQTEGVDESHNSDAFNMELTINGNKKKYAATNVIDLNENKSNIDLGLVDSPKFDLELKKGISLVQVSNNQGTKTYNFEGTDLAKIEIPEKYMKGSVVAITYTIKVTNTGAVPGYVNKVADYKVKDLDFNSGLNPEWYLDIDGNLYSEALAGRVINPGETEEVSLILTKTMTNENTGISNNTAEIAECSNDFGLEDIDSIPGNRNSSEDDFGAADIIVAIKTGGILFYGGIVLAVLAIFALGAYEINKRVLRKI